MVELIQQSEEVAELWFQVTPAKREAVQRVVAYLDDAVSEAELIELLRMDDADFLVYEWRLVCWLLDQPA